MRTIKCPHIPQCGDIGLDPSGLLSFTRMHPQLINPFTALPQPVMVIIHSNEYSIDWECPKVQNKSSSDSESDEDTNIEIEVITGLEYDYEDMIEMQT